MPVSISKFSLQTWVTLALDEGQVVQALVLGQSLRRVLTKHRLVVLINKNISKNGRQALQHVFDGVVIPSGIGERSKIADEMFCKLYCWDLYLVDQCIFIQPDAMIMKNCDELMDSEGFLFGSDGNIDSSLFVCKPNPKTFESLLNISAANKINNGNSDVSEVFKLTWGNGLRRLNKNVLLNVNFGVKYALLEKSEVPIVRLWGSTPANLMKLKEQIPDANFVKILLNQWLEIFKMDVEPLFVENSPKMSLKPSCPSEPIAIVGMGCRLPGSNNLDEFWKLLIEGGDAIVSPGEVGRLPPGASPDLAKNMKAGFLKCAIDECDGKFFGISPLELSFLDPQTRILLEVLWEALEDAAIDPNTLKGTNAGIFTGAWTQDYKELINRSSIPTQDYFRKYMGNAFGACAGRLSFIMGVTGPNIATESGCSSSMIGVELACQKLRAGETKLAMACGVNLVLHQFQGNDMDAICAPDGHCKTFDASADGFGRAEGCGVLILKKYSDALKDGDRVHAIIRGMGSAQEGMSRSLGTPTVQIEASAMKMALKDAGVNPWEVSYVESHGTGTPVGDPMEMAAIAEAYSENRTERLIVGSVKTNVGHTESCSGITGIIKTVLALKNQIIPPHRNFKTLNPNINLDGTPATIPLEATPWPRIPGKTRFAGVSSFGITGTDAHAILQEAPEIQPKLTPDFGLIRPQNVLTLSAKSESALEALITKYKEYLKTEQSSLENVAFTANTGRAHFNYRAAIVGKNSAEIVKNIEKKHFSQGKVNEDTGKICFLFTGQGSQYIGMGKTLYSTSPIFKQSFDLCESILRKSFNLSILPVLWPENSEKSEISRTIYSQTSIFVMEYCLLKLWEFWGVKPDFVLGHSLGEFAAATAAGILKLEDALTLVAERSRLIDELPRGQMIVLRDNKESVDKYLKEFNLAGSNLWLDYAAVNSNDQTVLAGDTDTVQKFKQFCENNKIKAIILEATHAFHSRHMDPMLKKYEQVASKIQYQAGNCGFISGMEGKLMQANDVNADYWTRHTRQRVEFTEACKTAHGLGCRLFIEIGPQPVLSALTMNNSSEFETKDPIVCLPSLRRNADEWQTILTTLSKLYVAGLKINFGNLDKFYPRRKVALPSYPFQRKKFWFDTKSGGDVRFYNAGAEIHPLLGCRMPNATTSSIYHGILDLSKISYVKDHMVGDAVIYPGAGFVEMSIAGGYATTQKMTGKFEFPANPISFENFTIEAPLQLTETHGTTVQVVVTTDESTGSNISVFRELNADSNRWIRHTSGKYSPFAVDYTEEKHFITEDLQSIKNRVTDARDIVKFYSDLNSFGLKFGPTFKSVKNCWKNLKLGELISEIPVPANSSEYLIHPVVIDAMIQSFMANFIDECTSLYVPIRIEKFIWFAQVDTDTVWAHSFPRNEQTNEPRSVVLYNNNGKLLALMTGPTVIDTTLSAVQSALKSLDVSLPSMYEDVWKPLPGPLENRADLISAFEKDFMPPEFVKSLLTYNEETDKDKMYYQTSMRLCYLFIQKALYKLGWIPKLGETFTPTDFCTKYGVIKPLTRFTNRLLTILSEEGYLSGVQNELGQYIQWTVTRLPPLEESVTGEIEKLSIVLKRGTPEVYNVTDIVAMCAEKLDQILIGKVSAVDILFPQNIQEDELPAEKFYRCASLTQYLDAQKETLRHIVMKYMELPESSRGIMQILEVGAGTGSLTKEFLPILEELKAPYKYTYTDISSSFFSKAERNFEKYSKKMNYKVFNLEKDPFDQGFSPKQFDLIVNVNVLHVCKDLSQCMQNLRQLTADGGLVYVAETTKPDREIDLVFGIFPDYWYFEDIETRPNHCIVSGDTWRTIMNKNGYEDAIEFPVHLNHGGAIIGKCSSELQPVYKSKELEAKPKSWIIFSGKEQETSDFFTDKLRALGRSVSMIQKSKNFEATSQDIYSINPSEKPELLKALTEITTERKQIEGIIYLWGDDESEVDQKNILEPFLYLSQIMGSGLFKPMPKLYILTSGYVQVGDHIVSQPAAATLLGFARTLRMELPLIHCKNIDMDIKDTSDTKLEEAFMEMWKNDLEFQIAYRQRSRNVLRMTNFKQTMSALTLPNSERFAGALPDSKAITDLRLVPASPMSNLKPDEIEIQTKAIALNFKDVFSVLKPIKAFEHFNTIGADFAGIVSAVGSNVKNRKVGDAVFGCRFDAGAVPSHTVINENGVVPIPEHWTFEEAVTLPVVFATAYHCIVTVADMQKGETILIHAGSGGVGLVAIQIAKHLGLNIIVTAGNRQKRGYLKNLGLEHIFNSRSTEYEKEIMAVTGGRGVDMVLNCLTSPGYKEASLNVCAPNARFVEMSKIDVWQTEDVAKLRPDVFYTIVDLTTVSVEVWKFLFAKMHELMVKNIIVPIPYTAFDLIYLREALNYLQKAKHIGKVIINMPSRVKVDTDMKVKFDLFNDRSSYLITGGLGGIGLEICKWMAEKGAKNIVLCGRSLPNSKAVETIEHLRSQGVNVLTMQGDVGDYDQCKELLQKIKHPSSNLPTLRGIMHAAGTLSDALLENQTWSKFKSTFQPKVNGGWNLHVLTKDYPLEHFVMFSSAVGTMGNFGQTNHAAANCYLDFLAHHRRSLGLPSTTVNWGQWGEVGVAAEMKINGFRAFSPKEAIMALELVLKSQKVQASVLEVDLGVMRKISPNITRYISELKVAVTGANNSGNLNQEIDTKAFNTEFEKAKDKEEKIIVARKYVEIIIRNILKLDSDDEVDHEQNLSEVGLDSLMMVEMKNSLQALVGNNFVLNPQELSNYQTITHLGQFISSILTPSDVAE